MILRASNVFERLERTIGIECAMPAVLRVVDRVLELIVKSKNILSNKKRRIEENWAASCDELIECKANITALNLEKRAILGGTSQRGRSRQLSSRAINEDEVNKVNDKILETRVQKRKLMDEYDKLVSKKMR